MRIGLVPNENSHVKGFVQVIPLPNSVTDKGCTLQSILGTPKGELTYIEGSGFEPNEELTTDGESYAGKKFSAAKAEPDG